ncbi:hypothetical protein ACLOJK_009491 [Asimina triloba]
MDVASLAVILQASLSPLPEQRKAAEESLSQMFEDMASQSDLYWGKLSQAEFPLFQYTPQHLVPPLLRSQLGECLKTIIHADYPEQWPNLLSWVKHNLQAPQVHGALYVLRILSRKYEFKSEEERTPIEGIIDETFPYLLSIFSGFLQTANPSVEIAELIKLLEIPKQLFDANVFNAWMIMFLNILERPVPLEGQLIDPELRKSWYIIEELYSPRTASMDFVSELVRKRGKENLQKFIHYEEASIGNKPYRKKDGALLAIGTLCDKLRKTEPYKSELERMLVQHVFPEFSSPVGHLRAKTLHSQTNVAAWVAGQYADINFSDQNNFRNAFHSVVFGLRDPELPVRVDSVFALRAFVEACKDLDEIRPILPQLLDEFFKLMNEVENEDLVFTLETIVDKFGEEMAPYALGLCQNLAAAFWKCMDTSEADEEGDDPGSMAAVGCLRAIGTILDSISGLPHLFIQIEPILLPILQKMLTTEGQDPNVAEEAANILVPLDNYVSRSTAHFLTCKDPDYQQSLWKMLSSVMTDKNMEDHDIEPAPKLIEAVFQNCKGRVDQWVEPYLRITVDRLRWTERPYLKCLLVLVVADALYYNSSLTLGVLQQLGVATDVFNLWFQMLQEVKKSGERVNFRRENDKKICCLGLTSLLSLPAEQLPHEGLERAFRATLELLVSYKDQVAESVKEEDVDTDRFQTDDEDDEDDSENEMVDDEDEDEANSQRQKLGSQVCEDGNPTAQAKAFQSDEEDDDLDDDYSDDDELQSPIDDVDPFVFFVDTIKAIQVSNPARFQCLMQTLDFHHQALASGIAQHADQRRAEIEKEKLEKAVAV